MKKLVLGLVVVVVIALGVGVFYLDRLVGGAIEQTGSAALGVPVRVGLVTLQPLRGSFGLRRLTIANPVGFETPHFLSLKSARARVGLDDVRQQPIIIPQIVLSGADINLERADGKTNYGTILESSSSEEPAKEEEDGDSPVVIRELLIRDITAQVKLVPGGALTDVDVEIPELKLTNLGAAEGGIGTGEVIQIATTAILDAVARKSVNLPAELATDVLGAVEKVPLVGGIASQLGEAKLLEEAKESQLGEAAGKAGEVLEGLGGLLGGGKKDDE